MNQINPIYLGLFLVVVLFLSVFKLDSQRISLNEERQNLKVTQKLVNELVALKDVYANKIKIKKELQRILNNPVLKASEIVKFFTNSSVKINSKSMDFNALNKLMGKILNASYNITSLKIKRLSDTKVSLSMVIKW
ncbi:MAG: hypothetical protein COB17_08450 [Sulfurimonas sp.]|nr:MAG: hypothetical protein COB17_08450 [Sulfurimonas sp.]